MKEVLWISRHEMSKEQEQDLERIAKDEVHLTQWKDTVKEIGELVPSIQRSDIIAAVLPTELLAELFQSARDKLVIQSVSERKSTGDYRELPNGKREEEFEFRHKCWQQIVKMELETKNLL